jgi:16S rRNA (guanine(1405)-N(7))-methyltransferase
VTEARSNRVTTRVTASRRYRDLDASLIRRLAEEEVSRSRNEADAVKRVKRRLHQAVAAYRPAARDDRDLARLGAAWDGDLGGLAFRGACVAVLRRHASTRERLPHLEGFFPRIWEQTGAAPASLADLGCGLGPVALPWMALPRATGYRAVDVDGAQLAFVDRYLALVGQPHAVEAADLAAGWRTAPVEAALLLKLVPLLDRRGPGVALDLLAALPARHAVVSFPVQSLGGRGKGMERTYRARLEALVRDLGARVTDVAEASVPNELVFVLSLAGPGNTGG